MHELSLFNNDGFGIKWSTKVDMPLNKDDPVDMGSRITPTAFLQRGKTPPPNEYPRYDTKQSAAETLVMLELWGMRDILSLPSLPGPLWLRTVAPDKVLSMGQIELLDI